MARSKENVRENKALQHILRGEMPEKRIFVAMEDVNEQKERKNWQSDSYIHYLPKYKALSEMVMKGAKYVFEDKKYDYDTFEITNMWSNILKSGENHRPHTHSNNILSCVYYV